MKYLKLIFVISILLNFFLITNLILKNDKSLYLLMDRRPPIAG
jgi:hypothetical protein